MTPPANRFEHALNAEQLAAATAPDGPMLALAAAGTGKTRTIVYRVAYLVEQGIDPERILLLTFTNKAAHEMLARATELVGAGIGGLWGGTFHHMANRILRRYAPALGYRHDYTILDREDGLSLIRKAISACGIKSRDFLKPEALAGLFGGAANRDLSLEDFIADRLAAHAVDPVDVLRVSRKYAELKKNAGAADFDDLLVLGLELFRRQPEIMQSYQERFLHVLVDEYQDTNPIQSEWVDRIAARHRNLMAVGDDFQSIYAWRGADYRNILTFPERYPDTRIIKLETNYRSTPEILDVANCCIAGNPRQFQKTIRPTREAGRKPELARPPDGDAQAAYVLERIADLRRAGQPLAEIAVLYRAHYQALALQLHLTRAAIPFVLTSGIRFFEQAHIKDVCSLLRILHNPIDIVAFTRLLGLLPRVGERTVENIWKKLGYVFDAWNTAHKEHLQRLLPAAARPGWKSIAPLLDICHRDRLILAAGDLLERFMTVFYREHLFRNYENAERRAEDIDGLREFIARFESMDEFLSETALLTNLDHRGTDNTTETSDALRLSTVHQAKGLEWNNVFVIWLTDGMFPSSRGMSEDEKEGESEERRLFYVAVTRARNRLFLCAPQYRRTAGRQTQWCLPSRFLDEIPGELMHRVSAVPRLNFM